MVGLAHKPRTQMLLMDCSSIIEAVLEAWAPALGPARAAYRGHVYRVFNFSRQILGSERRDGALAVAAAFHDIGIWSDGTFDYLGPSITRAEQYLRERRPDLSVDEITAMIEDHHRLRPVRDGLAADAVEAFRRADLVDVSRGWIRAGLDEGFLREALAAFPYEGFHGVLLRTGLSWFVKHPLRPLPMVRL